MTVTTKDPIEELRACRLTLATLADIVLGEVAADRSDAALIRAVQQRAALLKANEEAVSALTARCLQLQAERDNARADLARAKKALQILLESHDCLFLGRAEIPEELSAQFDIGLDDARIVVAAQAEVE